MHTHDDAVLPANANPRSHLSRKEAHGHHVVHHAGRGAVPPSPLFLLLRHFARLDEAMQSWRHVKPLYFGFRRGTVSRHNRRAAGVTQGEARHAARGTARRPTIRKLSRNTAGRAGEKGSAPTRTRTHDGAGASPLRTTGVGGRSSSPCASPASTSASATCTAGARCPRGTRGSGSTWWPSCPPSTPSRTTATLSTGPPPSVHRARRTESERPHLGGGRRRSPEPLSLGGGRGRGVRGRRAPQR